MFYNVAKEGWVIKEGTMTSCLPVPPYATNVAYSSARYLHFPSHVAIVFSDRLFACFHYPFFGVLGREGPHRCDVIVTYLRLG